MEKIFANLKLTMESGQPPHFLWHQKDGRYSRKIGGQLITLREEGGRVRASAGHEKHAAELLRSCDDLQEIYATISTDATIKRAISRYSGMRLTKNDEWETTVAFLCSQNSNLKRIRANVQGMLGNDGMVLSAQALAKTNLRKLNLGYREPYLKGTAAMVAGGEFDFAGVKKLNYADAREELQELPGVGPKVADCILLYGFGRLEAFPNDVWIGRAMSKWYGVSSPKKVEAFVQRRWGPLAGYAQQYLFALARDEISRQRP